MQCLLKTGVLGDSSLIKAASKCDLPKCAACEFGKAKRRPTESTQHILTKDHEQALTQEHFFLDKECPWITSPSPKKEGCIPPQGQPALKCGCIFIDHATGDIHVEHLINFTVTETIQAKQ